MVHNGVKADYAMKSKRAQSSMAETIAIQGCRMSRKFTTEFRRRDSLSSNRQNVMLVRAVRE